TILPRSGGWVNITWSGVDPKSKAFLAAYSPGSALLNDTALAATVPIKYLPCNTTSGSLRFALLNLRDAEYRFGLFTGGEKAPVLTAVSADAVSFAAADEPTQVHLSLTDDLTEMRVSWTSGRDAVSPIVRWWPAAADAAASAPANVADTDADSTDTDGADGGAAAIPDDASAAAGSTASYSQADMCGSPATDLGYHDAGLQHTVVMTELTPGGRFSYVVGDDALGLWTVPMTFTAAPPALASEEERRRRRRTAVDSGGDAAAAGSGMVRLAVFGDLGTAELDGSFNPGHEMEPPALSTMALLTRQLPGSGTQQPIGLVLHIGDISYARGYATQWDEFVSEIEPVAAAVPWMVAIGNHERDSPTTSTSGARKALAGFRGFDSGGECGVPYAWRFPMPPPADDPLADTPWYSFDYGPVHFTVISTEHDFGRPSNQRAFVAADFAAVDRGRTPWLVLAGHRPMYVDSVGPGSTEPCNNSDDPDGLFCPNDQPVAERLRESFEGLMLQHQVDLALWGHHHSYQRTCKVAKNKCLAFSTPLPPQGAVFAYDSESYTAPVHLVVGMAGMGLTHNLNAARPEPFEYATDQQYGLAIMEANATALNVRFLLDIDGSVADELWLFRKGP
ncbi:unnamed protein product, partial [Phaeothamnion confervicola]